MRGHDHGTAAAGNFLEEPHDAFGRHGVEVAGGLVGQQHLRVVQQGACDDQPLLLAPREFERHFVAFGLEVYELEHLVDPFPDLVFALPSRGFHYVIKVHEDIAVGQQLVVLEYDADPAAEVGDVAAPESAQVVACHASFAGEQLHLGVEGFEQGALAAADASDQVNEFARSHTQVHIRQHHLSPAHQLLGRGAAERVVRMVDGCVFQPYDIFFAHRFWSLELFSKDSQNIRTGMPSGRKKRRKPSRDDGSDAFRPEVYNKKALSAE